MTDLSTATLFTPLLAGGEFVADLGQYMWPSYRRTCLSQGGDHDARFVIDEGVHNVRRTDLEYMFHEWIGHHFVETFGGVTAFEGYVHALRLQVGGMTLVHSMDKMANYVHVLYSTTSGSGTTITTAATNADSRARYGTKAIVLRPSAYMDSTYAAALGNAYLGINAYPRSYPIDIYADETAEAVLEVEVRGYIHTLEWTLAHVTAGSASSVEISAQLSSLLTGLDFVSEGDLTYTSRAITNETDWIGKLSRIYAILDGWTTSWGCIAGRVFNFYGLNESEGEDYRRRAFGPGAGIFRNGQRTPDPLITPGGIVFTEDIFAGRPDNPWAATYYEDPRQATISGVEYSIDGVSLIATSEIDDLDAAAHLAVARRGTTSEEPLDIESSRAVGWLPSGDS